MILIKYMLIIVTFITLSGIMNASENYITSHNIIVKLNPAGKSLDGSDLIEFNDFNGSEFSLLMLKSINIDKVTVPEGCSYQIQAPTDSGFVFQEIIISTNGCTKGSVQIEYNGVLNNKPDGRDLKVRHANSDGIISDETGEGIYLPAGSFYPMAEGNISNYQVSVEFPIDFEVITSGVVSDGNFKSKDYKIRIFKSELPTDNLTLVGGKYIVNEKIHKGIRFAVYTFEDNKSAGSYIDSMIEYYELYTRLFGDYPYSSFSIVENFFATGFGMPNYTLISGMLMKMPWVFLSPGSLAHEFVHNWWGNSVYVPEGEGNWCEALTAFTTNYYYNKLTGNSEGMLDWRKKALISMTTLEEKNNYPLKDFKYQRNSDDAVIGYSKGAFLFYEIYKYFDEQLFFESLESLAKEFRGKWASWEDIADIFVKKASENGIKADIRKVFNQWLETTDLPEIKITNAEYTKGFVKVSISQDSDKILRIPLSVISANDTINHFADLDKASGAFTFEADSKPIVIEIDPVYMMLRKLNYYEIPYTMPSTLNNNPIIILPDEASPDYAVTLKFKDMLIESGYKIDFIASDKLNEKDWKGRPAVILGNQNDNRAFASLKNKYPEGMDFINNTLKADGKDYELTDNLLVINMTHPLNSKLPVTIIAFDKMENEEQFRRLFHYMSYSMLMISKSKRGRPLYSKEIFPEIPEKNDMRFVFPD